MIVNTLWHMRGIREEAVHVIIEFNELLLLHHLLLLAEVVRLLDRLLEIVW